MSDARNPSLQLVAAQTDEHLGLARDLFREYAAALGFDLSFQDFDRELAWLPGDYAPPRGRLLPALPGTVAAGCVALRKLSPGVCEVKRLYVRPVYHGQGIERDLVERAIGVARASGYREIRLDTVPQMEAAIALYRSLGFDDISSYRANPIPGARYMALVLSTAGDGVE